MPNTDAVPHLIQRVNRRERTQESAKGFDRIFQLDYMGSAEFEFGAIPQALKAMRAADDNRKVELIKHGKFTVYYVGSPLTKLIAMALFEDELKPTYGERKFRHKERTGIFESYHPVTDGSKYSQYDAWWALDGVAPFFLFRTKKHAEEFIEVLG